MAVSTESTSTSTSEELARFRLWLAEKIEASLPDKVKLERANPQTIKLIKDRYDLAKQRARVQIPPEQEPQFLDDLLDEILGFGPLEKILGDDAVTEVMVNRADLIYVEKKGKLTEADIQFNDDAHVERVIRKIIEPLGRVIDRDSPMVDARLPDGSRVNAVIPPCAIDGPNITIRKFS
ncbi:MAG: ATPase, T2SS/T4P/T4SS family, partial [Anaerolineae bacterium]